MVIVHSILLFVYISLAAGVTATGGKLTFFLYRSSNPWTVLLPAGLLSATVLGTVRFATEHRYVEAALTVLLYLMVFYGLSVDLETD